MVKLIGGELSGMGVVWHWYDGVVCVVESEVELAQVRVSQMREIESQQEYSQADVELIHQKGMQDYSFSSRLSQMRALVSAWREFLQAAVGFTLFYNNSF